MNALLNYEFKLDETSIEEFDLEYSIEVAKENIESYLDNITVNYFKKYSYKDIVWYVYSENSDTILTIDFRKYIECKNTMMLDVLKCWVSNFLLDYAGNTIAAYFKYLVDVLNITSTLAKSKVSDLEEYLLSEATKSIKHEMIKSLLNFLDFYDELDSTEEYIQLASELHEKLEIEPREIPSSRDCLMFLFALNNFFDNTPSSDWRYLYFTPIRIWWILTTKIPMRIGEFLKIRRDSLKVKETDNKVRYYLELARSKEKNNKKRIQVIDKIEIDKSFYNFIDSYIIESNKYGESDSLISYMVIRKLRENVIENKINSFVKKRNDRIIDHETFRKLLYDFYEFIIKNPPYNFSVRDVGDDDLETISKSREEGNYFDIERRLRPNDTRHLAFMFLKLQGLHPVEIARLGGHLSLSSQTHYFKHREFETDSSTIQLLRLFDMDCQYFKTSFFKTINEPIISSKINDEFRRRFVLKNAEPDRDKWDKLEIGWCSASIKRCKRHCFICDEYWKIEFDEFKTKYNEIIKWMDSTENKAIKVYNSLGHIYDQIHSNKNEQLKLDIKLKKVLYTKSKELKDLLESIGACVDHIYEQTGVNIEWQTSIQKTKSTNYLTDM